MILLCRSLGRQAGNLDLDHMADLVDVIQKVWALAQLEEQLEGNGGIAGAEYAYKSAATGLDLDESAYTEQTDGLAYYRAANAQLLCQLQQP